MPDPTPITGTENQDSLYGTSDSDLLQGLGGDDFIYGGAGDDILVGGTGNDNLWGEAGNDTYRFGPGFGNDYIYNQDSNPDSQDVIEFTDGLVSTQFIVRQLGTSLVLDAGDGNTVTLYDYFGSGSAQIHEVRFSDGVVWSGATLWAQTLIPDDSDQSMFGTDGDDVLEGGGGDDRLYGNRGNDTYRFGPGFGNDYIYNQDWDYGSLDVIEFTGGLVSSQFIVRRSGNNIILDAGDGNTVTIWDFFNTASEKIDEVRFSDGVVWSGASLWERSWIPHASNQNMIGTDGDDTLDGGGGNDELWGYGGNDTLLGGDGNDFLWGGFGNDQLEGGAGDDTLLGEGGNDTLIGGAGNDTLYGGAGNDIYRFSAGFGQDIIRNEHSDQAEQNFVEFTTGISAQDVRLERIGDSLIIYLNSSPDDRIVVESHFSTGNIYGETSEIDGIRFADGTEWDGTEIMRQVNLPTDANQSLYGGNGNDTIDGGGGDDYISGGAGNDTLIGGTGNDVLRGDDGDDILIGGDGDDRLFGGAGNDIYRFGPGFGLDRISNEDWDPNSFDVVEFTGTLVSTLFTVSLVDGHLVLDAGNGQQLTIEYFAQNRSTSIDEVHFADGVVWTSDQLWQMAQGPNDSDQELRGGAGDDVMSGGGGNDTLYGEDGNDILNGDEGNDTLEGGWGNDQLFGGEGDDILRGDNGNDLLVGGAGNDILIGGSGDDVYRFGLGFGQDTIINERERNWMEGTDFIEFEAGITSDMLIVTRVGDTLQLRLEGYPDDVITLDNFFTNSGYYAYHIDGIRFADGTVIDYPELYRLGNPPTDADQYLEGTQWGDRLDGGGGNDSIYGNGGDDVLSGGTGDDYLSGGDGDDILEGGAGNDELNGGSGNDTYRFARGDGLDQISAYNIYGSDVIEFAAGISVDDVVLIADGNDVLVRIVGTDEGIRITDFVWYTADLSIRFADGTFWDASQVRAAILFTTAGTAGADVLEGSDGRDQLLGLGGNDILRGYAGDDLLEGGAGNDTLVGGEGNDSYVFEAGWGSDTIRTLDSDLDGAGKDVIVFGSSVSVADIAASSAGQDLVLTRKNSTDRILIKGFFSQILEGGDRLVDEVRFSDGTVWTVDDLILAQQVGTAAAQFIHGREADDDINAAGGNDVVYGYAGDDVINGGSGHDRLNGGSGSDTYRFDLGWGQDIIESSAADALETDVDVVEFSAGVNAEDVRVYSQGSDLVLAHNNGDWITLQQFHTDAIPVQEVRFDDGTVWTHADLMARQMQGNAGDQYQYGTIGADLIQGLGGNDLLFGRDGDDVLEGGEGDDVLDGGAGADILDGGDGNDLFVMNLGSGHDRVISQDPDGIYWDVVQFGDGISADQISVTQDGRDVVLSITGTEDSLTLVDFLPEDAGGWPTAIDEVWFADGTVWDAYSIASALPPVDTTGELQGLVSAMAAGSPTVASSPAFAPLPGSLQPFHVAAM